MMTDILYYCLLGLFCVMMVFHIINYKHIKEIKNQLLPDKFTKEDHENDDINTKQDN